MNITTIDPRNHYAVFVDGTLRHFTSKGVYSREEDVTLRELLQRFQAIYPDSVVVIK